MYRKDELKEKILKIICNSGFSPDEEKNWCAVFSELSDFHEEMLQCIPVPNGRQFVNDWKIQCGITCLESRQLGKNYYFMSAADNITDPDFPDGKINEKDDSISKDGDCFIIGTGYLDCEYEELFRICGRDKKYVGKYSGGEFEYTLILQNNILNREKMLYQTADYYNINEPVIFAPMLRRLVYIETKTNPEEKITVQDLQLEKNGLTCLLGGWRAVWNIEVIDSPYGTKSVSGFKYILENDEYILPEKNYAGSLRISKEYDTEKEQRYILASSERADVPKNYLTKIRVCPVNSESDILSSEITVYNNRGKIKPEISRIYSRSDVFSFMKGFAETAVCNGVYTEYPDGLKVCAYEMGFEYPVFPEYFEFSERPKIFISFKKDENKYLFDRIVYLVHILQRQFPEYIWKGGYFT